MISAVDFVCLDTFQNLVPAQDMIAMSIGDLAQLPPANLVKFAAYLRLEFLDIEPHELEEYGFPAEVMCSPVQLEQLIAFVRAYHYSTQKYRLVAHCRMGRSRSAAAALVAHALTGCDFPRYADAHHANHHVVQLAGAALRRVIEIPGRQENGEPHEYLPLALQI